MKQATIRKYYFSNISTLLLPFFFITLSLVVFLQQFHFFSIKSHILENAFVEVFTIYFLLIGSVIGLFIFVRSRMKVVPLSLKGVVPFIIGKYDREKIIRREEQQKILKNFFDNSFQKKKYAFLVGKSGSGKSMLVSEYVFKEENVERFTAEDYSIQNNFEEKLKEIIAKCENSTIWRYIIIFDQFERALDNIKIFGYIVNFLKQSQTNNYQISIVFVCMNEDYARILEKLKSSMLDKI
jgi:hypothetical protein